MIILTSSPGRPSLPSSSSEAGLTQRDYLAIGLCAGNIIDKIISTIIKIIIIIIITIKIIIKIITILIRILGPALHVCDGCVGCYEAKTETRSTPQGTIPQHAATNGGPTILLLQTYINTV